MSMPVVDLRQIGRTYPGVVKVPALRDTNLRVQRGELVAVTGRSGSGKSTLLNLLGLLDQPTEGRYLLDGEDTTALRDRARSQLRSHRIGFVFQSFHLIPHRTAMENVQLGMLYQGVPKQERRHRAEESLHRVGLSARRDFLPRVLSGGEQQRVAIARAIAGKPSLLLADEPTGNLDSRTAAEILTIFTDLHQSGMTVIIVTHDASVAVHAHRQLSIVDGVLTEEIR